MRYRLICFDLDGTLVDNTTFIWQTLHEYFGTDLKLRKEMAHNFLIGKITYSEWAGWEVNQWKKKGANKKRLRDAITSLSLMKGAYDTLHEIKKRGYTIAIISGSLNIVIEKLIPDFKEYFKYILINRLFFDDKGEITGSKFTEYDMEKKADGLNYIAKQEGILLSECMFIGDNFNDMEIAKEAGFSIAFNSKSDELNKIVDAVIEKKDLREILKYI